MTADHTPDVPADRVACALSTHADPDEYARIWDLGYEAARAQQVAPDPTTAEDWLAARLAAARREAPIVGFRYQDGEVLSPEREVLSRDDELPEVVIDIGDGEWMTLAELHARQETTDDQQ